jgi:hypothetical protein
MFQIMFNSRVNFYFGLGFLIFIPCIENSITELTLPAVPHAFVAANIAEPKMPAVSQPL